MSETFLAGRQRFSRVGGTFGLRERPILAVSGEGTGEPTGIGRSRNPKNTLALTHGVTRRRSKVQMSKRMEQSRRRGYFDPRYVTAASARPSPGAAVSAALTARGLM